MSDEFTPPASEPERDDANQSPETESASTEPDDALLTPPPEDPYEGAVPPGYDWPTHGGYLGCLMGTISGALVGGFLGANLFSFLWASQRLAGPLFILLALVIFFVCVWALGRVGWGLGKRFYRAYEQPVRPVWGEDDEELPAPSVVEGSAHVIETQGGEIATS